MAMKFFGQPEEIAEFLKARGLVSSGGEPGGKHTFKARTGEIVHLYGNGTVQLQGKQNASLRDELSEFCSSPVALAAAKPVLSAAKNTRIFIVHGHDENARNELELVLRRQNLQPFILQNASSASKAIIEAPEANIYEESAFGIVLLTPDDQWHSLKEGEKAVRFRARQNVILEMGMIMAALSHKKMVILKRRGEIELPSDTDGILRIDFTTRVQEVVPQLVQHMIEAGIEVDTALIADAAR